MRCAHIWSVRDSNDCVTTLWLWLKLSFAPGVLTVAGWVFRRISAIKIFFMAFFTFFSLLRSLSFLHSLQINFDEWCGTVLKTTQIWWWNIKYPLILQRSLCDTLKLGEHAEGDFSSPKVNKPSNFQGVEDVNGISQVFNKLCLLGKSNVQGDF